MLQFQQAASVVILQLITASSWLIIASANDDFRGHKLFRLTPTNLRQVALLQKLHDSPSQHQLLLDFWNEPSAVHEDVYLRVEPGLVEAVKETLDQASVPSTIICNDLQSVIDEHRRKNVASRTVTDLSIYETYLTFDEMINWLSDAVTLCGDRCELLSIGRSYEGRDLPVIKITSGESGEVPKESIWIDAGIHAREWIAPATALYIIDRLITDYSFNPTVREMLAAYDWYIMPSVNPDGYQYTHQGDRLWRKTRSKINGSSCIGVDANRNFGFHWGTIGTSKEPCSALFDGLTAFSEPETRAIADFLISSNGTWKAFVTLHSYGQLWMAPYGYTEDKPDNFADQMAVARSAKHALERIYQTKYTVGSSSDILYRSSGTSRDWASGVLRVPYVYTVELRDKGAHAFLLPPDQIFPTAVETWEGIKGMIKGIWVLENQRFTPSEFNDYK